jgi:hypothetical protein
MKALNFVYIRQLNLALMNLQNIKAIGKAFATARFAIKHNLNISSFFGWKWYQDVFGD